MKTYARSLILTAALFAFAPLAAAQASAAQTDEQSAHHPGAAAASQMSEGEVRKVNKDAQKITLRHGELKNLGMPPMTMVFRVADPAMLDQVKSGDKVRFVADKVGGQYTVTQIETKD